MNEFSEVTKRFSNCRMNWIGRVICLGEPAFSLPGALVLWSFSQRFGPLTQKTALDLDVA
jgi:hypothetical protein